MQNSLTRLVALWDCPLSPRLCRPCQPQHQGAHRPDPPVLYLLSVWNYYQRNGVHRATLLLPRQQHARVCAIGAAACSADDRVSRTMGYTGRRGASGGTSQAIEGPEP